MRYIGAVRAVVTAADFDRGPTDAELDAIEQETPLIDAEVELLAAQIMTLDQPVNELDKQRIRRARRRVLAAWCELTNQAAAAVAAGSAVGA